MQLQLCQLATSSPLPWTWFPSGTSQSAFLSRFPIYLASYEALPTVNQSVNQSESGCLPVLPINRAIIVPIAARTHTGGATWMHTKPRMPAHIYVRDWFSCHRAKPCFSFYFGSPTCVVASFRLSTFYGDYMFSWTLHPLSEGIFLHCVLGYRGRRYTRRQTEFFGPNFIGRDPPGPDTLVYIADTSQILKIVYKVYIMYKDE